MRKQLSPKTAEQPFNPVALAVWLLIQERRIALVEAEMEAVRHDVDAVRWPHGRRAGRVPP